MNFRNGASWIGLGIGISGLVIMSVALLRSILGNILLDPLFFIGSVVLIVGAVIVLASNFRIK